MQQQGEEKDNAEVGAKKTGGLMQPFRLVLGNRDSNPDTMIQSHVSCHWTIPQ